MQYLKTIQKICTAMLDILHIEITVRKVLAQKLYNQYKNQGPIDAAAIVAENREQITIEIIDHYVSHPKKFSRPATCENQISFYEPVNNKLVIATVLTDQPVQNTSSFNQKTYYITQAIALSENLDQENVIKKIANSDDVIRSIYHSKENVVQRAIVYSQLKIDMNIELKSHKVYNIQNGAMVNFDDGLIAVEMVPGADQKLCIQIAQSIYKNPKINNKEKIQAKLDKIRPGAQVNQLIKSVFMLKNNQETSYVC